MAYYQIAIHNELDDSDEWVATLFEENALGVIIGEPISAGAGCTVREAVKALDFHHDWSRHLTEIDGEG